MSRTKRIERIAGAMEFARKLEEHTRECHLGAGFHIDRGEFERMWYATPFMVSRDADSLQASNWEVISEDLQKRYPETVETHHFGHWAFGWFDQLYVRKDDALAIREVERWVNALADYRIADEEHYSQREWDDNHPSDGQCYSGDEGCACEYNQHVCVERISADGLEGQADADGTPLPPDHWEAECPVCGEDFRPFEDEHRAFWEQIAACLCHELPKAGYVPCACCGITIIGYPWSNCDPCADDGDTSEDDCDYSRSWHCYTGYCDGSACTYPGECEESGNPAKIRGATPPH